jgi:hypothetical protein
VELFLEVVLDGPCYEQAEELVGNEVVSKQDAVLGLVRLQLFGNAQ